MNNPSLFGHKSNLDILRAFAVSAVLLHHLALTLHTHFGLGDESHRHFAAALGHTGVLMFFVHTSLVLMYSLERMHGQQARPTVPFYIRRFFRIYPLAISAIVLALVFHVPPKVWDTPTPVSKAAVVANLFLVQNIFTKQQVLGPLWSLPYEVQMYVVLPALFLVATGKRAMLNLSCLFAFFCLAGTMIALRTSHLNMAAYVPCFLSGVICYALRRRVAPRLPAYLWTPFLVCLTVAFLVANTNNEEPTFWSGWILCLILGLSINAFRDSKAPAANFIAGNAALYSYGIYLLHVPVLYFLFVHLHVRRPVAGVAWFFALTLAASVAAFHLIEAPFMDLGRRLSSTNKGDARRHEGAVSPAP